MTPGPMFWAFTPSILCFPWGRVLDLHLTQENVAKVMSCHFHDYVVLLRFLLLSRLAHKARDWQQPPEWLPVDSWQEVRALGPAATRKYILSTNCQWPQKQVLPPGKPPDENADQQTLWLQAAETLSRGPNWAEPGLLTHRICETINNTPNSIIGFLLLRGLMLNNQKESWAV